MLKMIKLDQETKMYVIAVLIDQVTYIKIDEKIPNIKERDVSKYWAIATNIPKSVVSIKDWLDLYESWGFGRFTYIEPRPSRKRKQKKITKKDLIRARIREFKKSLVKRNPEQYNRG